jgi:hypothetical protein
MPSTGFNPMRSISRSTSGREARRRANGEFPGPSRYVLATLRRPSVGGKLSLASVAVENTLTITAPMNVAMSLETDPVNAAQAAARDPIYEKVSNLSVLDAAYHLWQAKRRLDASEGSPLFQKIEPTPDVSKTGVLRDLIASTVNMIQHERENAQEGATLRRLLIAHPEITEEVAKEAIRRAVNLEDAGTAALISLGYQLQSVSRAVEIARDANPGFSEDIYRWLWGQLSYEASK